MRALRPCHTGITFQLPALLLRVRPTLGFERCLRCVNVPLRKMVLRSSVSVYGFFSFRIYAVTKKAYIPGLIWLLAFLQLLGRIVIFSVGPRSATIVELIARWRWLFTVIWSISVACDITIATTMVVVLRSQRSHARRETAALVDKLIVWTTETGMLTSVYSALMLAFGSQTRCCVVLTRELFQFVTAKDSYVWLPFYTVATARKQSRALKPTSSIQYDDSVPKQPHGQISLPSMTTAMGIEDTRHTDLQVSSSGGQVGPAKGCHVRG
ncbi:hypothetical protein C8R45DRAFT_1091296 [Mycena sanguinolenta]|nr:hypothetical protein C8R45DRAFT_1091296 [Mycena sanguinolenta]